MECIFFLNSFGVKIYTKVKKEHFTALLSVSNVVGKRRNCHTGSDTITFCLVISYYLEMLLVRQHLV